MSERDCTATPAREGERLQSSKAGLSHTSGSEISSVHEIELCKSRETSLIAELKARKAEHLTQLRDMKAQAARSDSSKEQAEPERERSKQTTFSSMAAQGEPEPAPSRYTSVLGQAAVVRPPPTTHIPDLTLATPPSTDHLN